MWSGRGEGGEIVRELGVHERNIPLFRIKLKDTMNYVMFYSDEMEEIQNEVQQRWLRKDI